MTEETVLPEPDRVDGAPHPRETVRLFGQTRAEAAFLEAHASGRLHHAWLITGPRGIGKATLAWRIARFLLATPVEGAEAGLFGDAAPATLEVPADHPSVRRSMQLAEPRLHLVRRGPTDKGDRIAQQITVDEVRKLRSFFGLSSADGGRRVVIVDAVDEMNASAANALLKVLEEPPKDAVLLLVCHQPTRVLPTIRSRCRELRCERLGPDDLADALRTAGADPGTDVAKLGALSDGSAGEALRLIGLDGLAVWDDLVALVATMPALDRQRAIAFAEATAKGGEARFDVTLRLIDILIARLARAAAGGGSTGQADAREEALVRRLAADPSAARAWADAQLVLVSRARRGKAVNLDPAALILDMVFKINETAAAHSAA